MCRCTSIVLLAAAVLVMLQPGMAFPQSSEQAAPFQWLAYSGETSGVKYATHRLQPLSLQGEGGPAAEIEQESVKVDAQTTRITRRSFMTSINGERQLTETVVEEIRRMPDDRVHAVRTVSRKDVSGRFSPVQQEIEDIVPSGPDSCQIKLTRLLPGTNNTLVEKEQVQQRERRKGDNTVEIDRTRYESGVSGSWTAIERRISQNTIGKETTRSEEQVYQYNVNNELALTQQLQVRGWKDSAGEHLQSESYDRGLDGKLRLSSRLTMIQTPQRNGQQQITEIIEKPSPAAPNEGLKLVRKIVENLQILGPNETEKTMEVLEPDVNGAMRRINDRQSIEVK